MLRGGTIDGDRIIRAIDGVVGSEIFTYLHLVKQTYSWGAR